MATSNSEKLQTISSLKREDGRQLLCDVLSWQPFDEEEDLQRSLLLDCLYDNVMFMVQKGFQWTEIANLLPALEDTLESCKGASLQDAVRTYSQKIQTLVGNVTQASINKFTEHFFTTYMRHFKLYQYVFTQPQDRLEVASDLEVVTPDPPVPFTQAKNVDVYEYEQKYESLEEEEVKKCKQHEEQIETLQTENKDKVARSLEAVEGLESPLSRQDLVELIHQVASVHVTAASDIIKTQVTNTMDELDIMLEKTALPRPQVLGAPPRYKTKTPIPSSPSKRQVPSRETIPTARQSRQSSRAGKK